MGFYTPGVLFYLLEHLLNFSTWLAIQEARFHKYVWGSQFFFMPQAQVWCYLLSMREVGGRPLAPELEKVGRSGRLQHGLQLPRRGLHHGRQGALWDRQLGRRRRLRGRVPDTPSLPA